MPVQELFSEVDKILNEIGYDKQLPVVRWLGVFVAKILKKLYSAIYINESQFLRVSYILIQQHKI